MNHEVTKKQDLLNSSGKIVEEGWARFPVWEYERSKIKASFLKIKEWDYYLIHNIYDKWSVCATISDLGYAGLFALSFIDYNNHSCIQDEVVKLFTRGKLGLSPSSVMDNNVGFSNENIRLSFIRNNNQCLLTLGSTKLKLDANFEFFSDPNAESINIATSWAENRRAFYLNEKKNCMPVSGRLRIGDTNYEVKPESTFATLDWGRGRWTRENTWYWGSASGKAGNNLFGFNLGYGFTDRSVATENALFFNNKVHKLEKVSFLIPDNYMKKWSVVSSDKRFKAEFIPALDRSSDIKNPIAHSVQHQVFGSFYGRAILDDGREIELNDFTGFLEKVYNKW